jgi:magnesium chelatase family protein
MLATVYTCAVVGLDGALVEAEVDVSNGKVGMTIVGLPDTAVQESRERVRSAIKNSGAVFPLKRITVNLAPADIRKEGPAYDLPIALGILFASRQVFADITDTVAIGELSLDGGLRHTNGRAGAREGLQASPGAESERRRGSADRRIGSHRSRQPGRAGPPPDR